MPQFESAPVTTEEWYRRAKAKLESFIRDLDATLRVEIDPVTVHPPDSSRKYATLALRFIDDSHPQLNWTMEIEPSQRYIDDQLESVVRKIYAERTASNRPSSR